MNTFLAPFRPVVQKRIYLLTNKQYARRFSAFLFFSSSVVLGIELQRQYMLNRADIFAREYEMLRTNANYYHTLHEQVNLSLDSKAAEEKERKMEITRLRS